MEVRLMKYNTDLFTQTLFQLVSLVHSPYNPHCTTTHGSYTDTCVNIYSVKHLQIYISTTKH